MSTFSTDADILAVDPDAQKYLPKSEQGAGVFTRIREHIKQVILDDLSARSQPILESDLSTPADLKLAEVYGVLSKLLLDSASKPGVDSDYYTQRGMDYRQMFEARMARPISTKTDTVRAVSSIRTRRC